MRKAASQTLRHIVPALVVVFVFFVSFTLVRAYTIDPSLPASTDQDTGDAITGYITVNGTEATGHVTNSGGDTVQIGLASYLKVDIDLENQSLHDSTQITLGPGESKEMRVAVPCWSQVDLFRIFPERPGQEGGVITSFKGNVRYGQRLIAAVHTVNMCGQDDPGETPSPTPVATETPVQTPTPTDSGTPRTDLSDNRSDNLGCSVRDCSGNVVGGTGGVVAGVSTDSTQLPATGSTSTTDVLGYGFMMLTIGVLMRNLAHSMN